ncbi:hypothetical protein ACO0QE_001942 [Hanseniaspora vineae]
MSSSYSTTTVSATPSSLEHQKEIKSNQWLKLSQLIKLDQTPPKLNTLITYLSNQADNKKRIGVLSTSKAPTFVIQCLLMDPYHSDQEWVSIFNNRYKLHNEQQQQQQQQLDERKQKNRDGIVVNVVKYSPFLEINTVKSGNGVSIVTYGVPCKKLLQDNIEIIEYDSKHYGVMQKLDQALFYVNTDPNFHGIAYPHLNVKEGKDDQIEKFSVESAKMLQFLQLFYKDKTVVSKYLKEWDDCGFTALEKELNKFMTNYSGLVVKPVERLTLDEIILKDKDLNSFVKSDQPLLQPNKKIAKWYTDSHHHLQAEIMAIKPCTMREIYLYSESKLELTLLNKFNIIKPIIDNLNYIKGQLSIPQKAESQELQIVDVKSVVKDLHHQINSLVYSNFWKLQLPMVLIGTLSVLTSLYTVQAMLPIVLFGVMLGVFRVSMGVKKLWAEILNQKVIDPVRNFIELENKFLVEQSNLSSENLHSMKREKLKLIKNLYK